MAPTRVCQTLIVEPVFSFREKKVIRGKEEIEFSSFSSFHLIVVTARAKGEKQFTPSSTDDEDLTVEIDGKKFPKLTDPKALIDSPASFNGGKLHNLSQTVYFLTFLRGKDHRITLEADKPHSTATLESLEVYTLNLSERLTLNVGEQAEDGDRRPWLTFALVGLPLKQISTTSTLRRRFIDSDDVKVMVDGEIRRNLRSLFHKFWYFVASALIGERQSETFLTDLPFGSHYLEFHADRMPIFHDAHFDFGRTPEIFEAVPTVNNPKWTEDFYDDTETMLLARIIYGEAGNQSPEAKTGVGWSVKNRIGRGQIIDRRKIYNNYHDVVLDDGQYAFLS